MYKRQDDEDPGENMDPPTLTNPVVPGMSEEDRIAETEEIGDEDADISASSTLMGIEATFRQQAENERRLAEENRLLMDSGSDASSYVARSSESDDSFSSVSSDEDSGNAGSRRGVPRESQKCSDPVCRGIPRHTSR